MGKATASKAKATPAPKPSGAAKKAASKAKAKTTDKSKEKDLATAEESLQGQKFWTGYKKLCAATKPAFESETHIEYMKQLQKAS